MPMPAWIGLDDGVSGRGITVGHAAFDFIIDGLGPGRWQGPIDLDPQVLLFRRMRDAR